MVSYVFLPEYSCYIGRSVRICFSYFGKSDGGKPWVWKWPSIGPLRLETDQAGESQEPLKEEELLEFQERLQ